MSKEVFQLTPNQQQVFDLLLDFIDNNETSVFILCGYAGTGKTTMMKEVIRVLEDKKRAFSLLASTGRAAKILSNATGHSASTIHSLIYKFSDLNQDMNRLVDRREQEGVDKSGQLLLTFSLTPVNYQEGSRYYIIDESSMISDVIDKNATQANFGSGKLLADLFLQDFSPALSDEYIQQTYGKSAIKVELKEIVRQSKDNDLILSSRKMRHLYLHPPVCTWGKFPLRGYKHIHLYPSQYTLLGAYIQQLQQKGYNKVTMITHSNKACTDLTHIIRPALGFSAPQIMVGDLLLVTQNNLISGLMNGDMVTICEIGVRKRLAGLTFVYVTLKELFSEKIYSQLLIEDIVYGSTINLTQTQQKELFVDFFLRMREKGIPQQSEKFRMAMRTDPYLNALRAVFGYVLTCHKAQGGEWDDVFLDIPRKMSREPQATTYQWLYTAMTRARNDLHLVDDFYVANL